MNIVLIATFIYISHFVHVNILKLSKFLVLFCVKLRLLSVD